MKNQKDSDYDKWIEYNKLLEECKNKFNSEYSIIRPFFGYLEGGKLLEEKGGKK